MKLVTEEVKKRLEKYPLYSQDGKKKDAICVVKFFMCGVNYTWYVLEADLENYIATVSPSILQVKVSTATSALQNSRLSRTHGVLELRETFTLTL